MALFDIFRKKEKELYEKKKERDKIFPKAEKPAAKEKEIIEPKAKKSSILASKILISRHITEKATSKSGNSYVFKVNRGANKKLVKKSLEELYGVKVKKIKIANMPHKSRFILGRKGRKSGYKKAIVALQKGETLQNI